MTDEIKKIAADLDAAVEDWMTDEKIGQVTKKFRDIAADLSEDFAYEVRERLGNGLSSLVLEMTKKTVTALLEGNQSEITRYLGCEVGHWTGRSDSPCFGAKRALEDWHPVIHGELFEHGSMKLRKAIVDAHKELIASERIKDLEDQVASLVAQVNKLTADRDALGRRLRDYAISDRVDA